MQVRVTVRLKPGVLDPQGKAVETALHTLGMDSLSQVRQGKVFEFQVAAGSADEARSQAEQAAQALLANLVIEDFQVEVLGS
jgi:phosphoribosylformylglycinamidine synthase